MRKRLAIWRSFGGHLVKREGWPKNPAGAVDWAKLRTCRSRREIVGRRGLARMIETAAADTAGAGFRAAFAARNAAIMAILGHCGLRLAELVGLDVDHVRGLGFVGGYRDIPPSPEGQGPMLREVVRKGGKTADIPLNGEAAHRLGVWLALRDGISGLPPDERALFVSRRRSRICKRAVQIIVAHAGKAAGIRTRVTPHLLRHGFCDELFRRGVPPPTIQGLMGHTSISTTVLYAHPDADDERRAVETLVGGDYAQK